MPAFSAEETARGIRDQAAAIKSSEDQPLALAFRRLMPFLFPHSVYGYLQLGEIGEVEKYTRENVLDYWNRQKTRPWVLAVAGQFSREDVLNFARNLPAPTTPEVSLPVPQWTGDKALTIPMPDRNQAHLMLIFKTAPDSSPDAPALDLLETTLSGMGGPLFRELRDRQGLGYTVTALGQQNAELGMLIFYIGTEPGKLKQAEEGFRKILADLHSDLLPVSELNRGKNQLEGDYYRGLQSLGARSREAAALDSGRAPPVLHPRPDRKKQTGNSRTTQGNHQKVPHSRFRIRDKSLAIIPKSHYSIRGGAELPRHRILAGFGGCRIAEERSRANLRFILQQGLFSLAICAKIV